MSRVILGDGQQSITVNLSGADTSPGVLVPDGVLIRIDHIDVSLSPAKAVELASEILAAVVSLQDIGDQL